MGNHPAWLMLVAGFLLAVAGLVWLVVSSMTGLRRLPGDIYVAGERYRFYFPIVTCIVISVLATFGLWLLRLFSR